MCRNFKSAALDPFARADDDAAMTALPALDVLIAFTAASFVLIITPGPDMTLFIGQTLSAGRARGFAALMGASTGLFVHSMLAAFGLSALLAASSAAVPLVKTAGR